MLAFSGVYDELLSTESTYFSALTSKGFRVGIGPDD